MKFGTVEGMNVRLAVQNFTPTGAQDTIAKYVPSLGNGNASPKWQKFPLLVKIHPAGANPLIVFLQLLGAFIRQTTGH